MQAKVFHTSSPLHQQDFLGNKELLSVKNGIGLEQLQRLKVGKYLVFSVGLGATILLKRLDPYF